MIRLRTVGAAALMLAILVPAGVGFSMKFRELLSLSGDPEGAFAIMPVVSYLTTSVGFFFLFFYAAMHGMFSNIERPKYSFLDTERRLDADDEAAAFTEI
jgi:hypothetical protein